jgi:hypothetical protein
MNTYFFRNSILLISIFLLFISGCSKDSLPTGPTTPSVGDIFPLVQNHAYVFNDYMVDVQNNKIFGTDHREAMVVGPLTTIMGKSANLIIDSVYYSIGALQSLDTIYIAKEANGTLSILSNSLFFMPFVQPAAGIGNVYNIYTLDTTIAYQGNIYNQSVKLTGVLNQKENVQVAAGSFSAYRLDITEVDSTKIGTQLISSNEGKQTYWLVENIGPVKILQPGSSSGANNTVQELISKNF